jgi:probable phosphoglycerate mutase
MQVLLVRHALPLRNEPGEGSDPDLAELGRQQALRLPAGLARFPITRLISSPQRRAVQTAEPVSEATTLPVDIDEIDERLAEYDRGMSHYMPLEEVRVQRPEDWNRMAAGQLPESVDTDAFRARVLDGLREVVAGVDHGDTVAVFTHGGVINVVLHDVLDTPNPLGFPIDYASVTLLRYSRKGRFTVGGVNNIEHVWDLLPHRQR